jgi:hypothetical protein
MSADNGIYILRTLVSISPRIFEYRVKHLQAIDNLGWDSKIEEYTQDPDIHIKNARKIFAKCFPIETREEALKEALKRMEEIGYVEYGIQEIEIDRIFKSR